jgi:hypothetical protein
MLFGVAIQFHEFFENNYFLLLTFVEKRDLKSLIF